MRMCKFMTVFIALILGISSAYTLQVPRKSLATTALQDNANSLPMLNYLFELGKSYNCFFTIEEAWREDDLTDSIINHWLQRTVQNRSLEQELDHLRQSIPNFSYEIDRQNPKIIHINDSRLAQQKDYALEAVIKTIDFTGKVHDMVNEIKRQGIAVSALPITFNNESMDLTTVVRVRGEGLKVREALSNFIELEGRRSRILWVARTKIGKEEISSIRYP